MEHETEQKELKQEDYFSPEELAEFKNLLFERRKTAVEEFGYLNGKIMSVDKESSLFKELSEMYNRQEKYIENIDKALYRIENGCYGICSKTGKFIDKARLRAIPQTTFALPNYEEDEQTFATKNLETAVSVHNEFYNGPTVFFNRLFPLLDGIDVTMKLKRKNDKITLSFLPETTSDLAPVIITGTADELDEGFFQAIKKPIEEAKGLKVFLDSYKDSVKKAGVKTDEKKPDNKKPASKTAEKKKEAKAEKKVEQKTEAPDMFADVK